MTRKKSDGKIGRNAPCWCGSGQKYKKCHLAREDEERIARWQTDKEFKRVLDQRRCLAPGPWKQNCSSQISRAHTVPRSGSLARIARDGHVYSFLVSIQELEITGGIVTPELVGIKKASTFTGFCSEHDRSIFAPLETMPFAATPEQCFLLCYRALSREFFTKQSMASMLDFHRFMDRGKPVDDQYSLQDLVSNLDLGYSVAMKDLAARKSDYDGILVTSSFLGVRAYVIELGEIPPVMCSGGFYPEQDFGGYQIQDLGDLNRLPHLITVTSFHGGGCGAIVLSWLEEDDPSCVPFVESLHRIGDDEVTDALLRLLFTHFENVQIQPQWWETRPSACREALMKRFNSSIDPLESRTTGYLVDDGLRFDTWQVVERRCLGFEF